MTAGTPIAPTMSEETVVEPVKESLVVADEKLEKLETHSDDAKPLKERFLAAVTTREGWFGDYDYAWLCTPQLPFISKRGEPPFYGVNDKIPIFMAAVLGLQHALAMLGGLITPPIVLSGAGDGHLNLDASYKNYLISAALITCGLLTIFSISAFPLPGNRQLGTGLISVLGTSFAFVPVAEAGFKQMYSSGFCQTIIGADGVAVPQPCPQGWGAFLGTCMLCCWIEVALSQLPPKVIKKVFPPLVSGIVLTLVGVELTGTGMKYWAGGAGPCLARPATGFFSKCPNISAPNAVPWGHSNWIGLGFSVWVTIILIEVFGSPFMKSASVVLGLAVGYIIAAATGYITTAGINAAPSVTFLWVKTFPISINAPLILPCLFVFIVLTLENIGDVTATCDVSNVEVEGPAFEKRIRGGLLADGLAAFLSTLFTNAPVTTFAQNNGVIALTKCANRQAGYWCCFWLILAGVFSKFAAFITAMPDAVLGGMTSFLFCSVAVSGIRIPAKGSPGKSTLSTTTQVEDLTATAHDSGSTGSSSDGTETSESTVFDGGHESEAEAELEVETEAEVEHAEPVAAAESSAELEPSKVSGAVSETLAGPAQPSFDDDSGASPMEGVENTPPHATTSHAVAAPAADAMDLDQHFPPHPVSHLHVPPHTPPTHIPIPPNYPEVTHPDDVPPTPIRGESPLRAFEGVRGHTGLSMEEEELLSVEAAVAASGPEEAKALFEDVNLDEPGTSGQGVIGDHQPIEFESPVPALAVHGQIQLHVPPPVPFAVEAPAVLDVKIAEPMSAVVEGEDFGDEDLPLSASVGVSGGGLAMGSLISAVDEVDGAGEGYYWDLRVAAACKPKNPRAADRLPAICREDCGEDAYYAYEGKGCWALGVADGVGGWTSLGVDPSLFAWDLMNCCQEVSKTMDDVTSSIDPERVLAEGYRRVVEEGRVEAGSSTACIVAVDKVQGIMRTTNLGDSGAIVIRPSPPPIDVTYPPTPLSTSPGEPQVVPPILPFHIPFRTTDLQHYFNAPYQLSVLPPAMRNDPTNIVDSPADAITEEFEGGLREGDVIVVGTDGVWDNLWEEEIIDRLRQSLDGFGPGWGASPNASQPPTLSPPGSPSSSSVSSTSSTSSSSLPFEFDAKDLGDPALQQPQVAPAAGPLLTTPIHTRARDLDSRLLRAARQLCEDARDAARNARKPSPFARNARRAGHLHFGGKLDDVTLLIAYVYRTPGNSDGRDEVSTTEARSVL
ncbi:hypothetical protein HDU93_005560 [Gonapodya sp. JEL0774]|nr:hypothetical protein HDU93_005560 [Gonapodya sp. JEL0774]